MAEYRTLKDGDSGIASGNSDMDLYAKGININHVSLFQTEKGVIYEVSYEFLAMYKDHATRWVKDVILTTVTPNDQKFRESLVEYAEYVRGGMKAINFKTL